ncbi:MAG: MBOAT family protein [Treponema sp.]|nr:MBOAT family protein [Treponema sp.]
MVFSSITFLYFFLPAVVLLYFILPLKAKNCVLFISSVLFYAWGERILALLFVASIVIGWLFGLIIEKKQNTVWNKFFLISAVIIDLGILFYFKYTDFFIESFNQAFKTNIPLLKIALPIGISFYTFQLLSYEVDVYRGSVKAQKNFIDFAAYVSMFPQLIAGPIVRYADIETQLTARTHTLQKISEGIGRFIIGFSKKVLIANTLGELTVQFRSSSDLSVLYYWLYAIAYMLQIYYDFSGYSDMAIGLGKVFGFDFMENFNYPYISKSITEFWRRWHISLGSWFRDYVYIPLGGNRKGIGRQMLNIFVVWMLTGFWHGADWNFILWGLFFAILLLIEKLFLKKYLDKLPVLGHVYVIFTVMMGFVLFNASSLSEVLQDFKGLFGFQKLPFISKESVYYLESYGITILLGIICATPLLKNIYLKLSDSKASKLLNFVEPVILLLLLLLGTAFLVDGSFNPFLYFRF